MLEVLEVLGVLKVPGVLEVLNGAQGGGVLS
jgi:hypothetical protein